MLGSLLSLLTLNILTLTNSLIFDSLSGMLTSITDKIGRPEIMADSPSKRESKQLKSIRAENKALKEQSKLRQSKVKKIGNRIARRTTRNAAMHVTSAAGEAVPYIGAAVVVGALSMEVYDSCQTLTDMEEMLAAFEIESSETRKERVTVCGKQVPTVEEITANVKAGWREAYTSSVEGIQEAASKTGEVIKGTSDIALESAALKVATMREAVGEGLGRFVDGSKSRWKKTSQSIGETTYNAVEASKNIYFNTVNRASRLIESALD